MEVIYSSLLNSVSQTSLSPLPLAYQNMHLQKECFLLEPTLPLPCFLMFLLQDLNLSLPWAVEVHTFDKFLPHFPWGLLCRRFPCSSSLLFDICLFWDFLISHFIQMASKSNNYSDIHILLCVAK